MKKRNLIEESTYNGTLYFGTWTEKLALREIDTSGNFPIGLDFLRVSDESILRCQNETNEAVKQFGQSIENHLQSFGTMLSLLDRVASCVWGCSRGDHILEYITGRVVGYSQSTFLLAKSGLYDEAFLLVRSLGEVANLFALFVADSPSFDEWKKLSKNKRISKFGPGAVRKKLDLMSVPLPCDSKQYEWLCEIAAHATPYTKPQVHQSNTRPSVGGTFQQDGFKRVLKEVSLVIASIGVAIVQLTNLEESKRDEIMAVAKTLMSFA